MKLNLTGFARNLWFQIWIRHNYNWLFWTFIVSKIVQLTPTEKVSQINLKHTKVYLAASQGLPAMRATRAKEAKILSMTFFSECRKANDGRCRALCRFNFQGSKAFHAPLYSWLMALRYSGTFASSPPVEWRPFFHEISICFFRALSTPWRKSDLACWDTPDEKLMSSVIVLKKYQIIVE